MDGSGMKKELKNTDKVMVSGRIPLYVKEYCEKNKIPISKLLLVGFDAYRENDYNHAMERLRYHEERVIHWKQKLIQRESEINTKEQKCITIKEAFIEQGRGSLETKRQDLNWLSPKVDRLINDGIPITLEELYEFCKRK